jgi:hypothetical protein
MLHLHILIEVLFEPLVSSIMIIKFVSDYLPVLVDCHIVVGILALGYLLFRLHG